MSKESYRAAGLLLCFAAVASLLAGGVELLEDGFSSQVVMSLASGVLFSGLGIDRLKKSRRQSDG